MKAREFFWGLLGGVATGIIIDFLMSGRRVIAKTEITDDGLLRIIHKNGRVIEIDTQNKAIAFDSLEPKRILYESS